LLALANSPTMMRGPTLAGLIWLSLVRIRRLACGLDLLLGPCSELFDQDEGRRSVQGGRLLALVAELVCPRRQHIRLGKLIRCLDVVSSTRPMR
jgi:hypothetical protein